MHYLLVFSIKINLFLYANCQGYWSPWADCTAQEKRPCYHKRDLICNNGTTKGIQCVQGQDVFEQYLTESCNGSTCNPDFVENTTEWKAKQETEVCDGECYDAERTDRQSCAQRNSRRCTFIHVTRCYKEATCSGIWKTVESDCSFFCGGGVKTSLTTCVDVQTDQPSYNCNGTDYGKMNQSVGNINCNTQPCPPSWTPWTNIESCSVSCGGGIQKQRSMCIYNGSVSTLCDDHGKMNQSVGNINCNTQPCPPSWTPWTNIESCSVSCGGGIQKQRSMCIYNGSVSTLCDGKAVNRLRYEFCNEVDCVSSTVSGTSNNSDITIILVISIISVAVAVALGIVAFLVWKLKSRTVPISNQSNYIYENAEVKFYQNEKTNERSSADKSFELIRDQDYETINKPEVVKDQDQSVYENEKKPS